MARLLVLDVVGLTRRHLGPDTPHLAALASEGFAAPIEPVLPAVTCSVQATYLTGTLPREHGVVGNGWYYRERAEVALWKQARGLVQAPMVWDVARERDPSLTCAQLFWWFNMFADVAWSVTPRPAYLADGRKVPDVYADPPALRRRLVGRLGQFPLFQFWGPGAGIASTRWIADATVDVLQTERPRLTFAYLPHLDYDHQRYGPDDPRSVAAVTAVDAEAGRLIDAASFGKLAPSALTDDSIRVAEKGGLNDLPSTFVPGRNAFFLTLAAAYAVPRGIRELVIGTCETDFSGYPDCREAFVASMESSLSLAMGEGIRIHRPLMFLSKAETFALADRLGRLETVVRDTHTCYEGVRRELHAWGYGCGECPACRLRKKGFEEFEASRVKPAASAAL